MEYWLTRLCFQRALAFIYLIGFLNIIKQFRPLAGSNGLLPVANFIKRAGFWDSPSLFFINCNDTVLLACAWIGLAFAIAALAGFSERWNLAVSAGVWLTMWVLYLSFVNVGQTWYGFGWESILLETGFLAVFLGPAKSAPPVIIIWLLRWILFRIMFGAGLIKLRGDPCWRDLTCMVYHYETQPIPNPLSWYFHRMPLLFHKAGVLFTHFVELVVPWFYFGPKRLAAVAGLLTVVFQVSLILSGNLSWLNYLTIALCIACFSDEIIAYVLPLAKPAIEQVPLVQHYSAWAYGALVAVLSVKPAMNMISSKQIMNTSFDPFHLVGSYGAFGSITRVRNEIVIEGTSDNAILPSTQWKEYEFMAKPGRLSRMPSVVSPYHLRLDWLMWFAAMGDYSQYPWILNLVNKLLQNDPATLGLMSTNPFVERPPRFIRAELYEYRFTDSGEKNWWHRERVRPYLPPLSLESPEFRRIIDQMEWDGNP